MQPAERLDRLAEQLGYRMRQRLTLLAQRQIEAGASLIQLQSDRAGRDGKAAFGYVQTADAHGHADPPAFEEAGVAVQRPSFGRPQPAEGHAAGLQP